MRIKEYESTVSMDWKLGVPDGLSTYFSIAGARKRFSLLFVVGTIFGTVLVVAAHSDVWVAIQDLSAPEGLHLLSITIPFAGLASLAYTLTERSYRQMLIRVLAGVSMSTAFFLLVWNADKIITSFFGINMQTAVVADILFPFTMFLISVIASVSVEYTLRLVLCQKSSDPIDAGR